MDVSEYCRELEAHLCRKNDGHLIRIAGPSFTVVSRWATDGVPLKVAMGGIDRYFERYYRKGPRRRPVKIDFCEADVLDLFDEWRRATGVSAGAAQVEDAAEEPVRRRGPSLREHLERVLLRLSTLRATGTLDDRADALIDQVSSQLDVARGRASLRGEARRAVIERLQQLDRELVAMVIGTADAAVLGDARREAGEELAAFRAAMAPDAYAEALEKTTTKALRDRLRLPILSFT